MRLFNMLKKYYVKIPLKVTNILGYASNIIPAKKRFGKVYENQLTQLDKEQYASSEVQAKGTDERFLALVRHAYEHVPYYRNLFDQHQIKLDTFTGIKDIQKIPFLTREQLTNNRDQLLAENIDRNQLIYKTTSGTTGNPVGFYLDEDTVMKEWAYINHLWSRIGYKPDNSRLVFRGAVFREQARKGKNWQYDALRKELSCNIFDMNAKNLKDYCRAIERYKPDYIHGYMSAIVILAKYIAHNQLTLKHQFKGILAISENVIDSQRQYVEKIFGCRVYSFYGHSERLVIAGECEKSHEYHIEPSYGYIEIIDEDGQVIEDDQIGEIVATGFCNQGMPLIRYRTGDMASWSTKFSCSCGRNHLRIQSVYGRWRQDVLVNQEHSFVSLTALNMHSNVFDQVIRYQYCQDTVGEVTLKLVVNRSLTADEEAEIRKQLNEKTQEKIAYTIEYVDDLPIKANGKYSMIDQQLDLDSFFETVE